MNAQINPGTLKFLAQLKKNNNKEWFEKNRPTYEAIRSDLLVFAAELISEVGKFDASIKHVDPKKCLFRINRDIRFSKDKSPYKTSMGVAVSQGGKNFVGAGYYVHLQPNSCFLGGGIWMPMPDDLKKIRQEIDYNFKDFKKIIEVPSFKKTFGPLSQEEKLTRPPKGYDENSPAIEYLKLKSFTCGCKQNDKDVLSNSFAKRSAAIFKDMYPFIKFLNQAVR